MRVSSEEEYIATAAMEKASGYKKGLLYKGHVRKDRDRGVDIF